VTLWHRVPRAVYSVYGEEEYLSEDGVHARGEEPSAHELGEEPSTPHLVEAPSRRSSPARLVGLGLLMGVIVSAAALVVLNVAHRPAAASSTVSHAGSAHTATHASIDGSVGHGSAVGVSNRAAPRARGALGFLSTPPSTQHDSPPHGSPPHDSPSHGSPSRRLTARRSPARGSIGHDSTESMRESAQPGPPSTSEAAWPGAQAPPTGGEFDFEARRR
jgi:hypothetical protein